MGVLIVARITGIDSLAFSSLAHIVPFTHHDRMTYERLLYAMVAKMEDVIAQYNDMDTISTGNMDKIKDAYAILVTQINKALDDSESDYADKLNAGLAAMKKLIDGTNRTFMMDDPTSGLYTPIDDVLNRVYDYARVHAMTAAQMDARGLTANQLDTLNRSAKQLDLVGFYGDDIDPDLSYGGYQGGGGGNATIRGTGFPEGVVTAPIGTLYIDTTGKNGAFVWLKVAGAGNTGWFVISGDTGWRNLNTLRASVFTEGDILWRRTHDRTILRIVNATFTAGGQITTGTIPNPANLWSGYEGPQQVLRSNATAGILFVIDASGSLGINNLTVGSGIYGMLVRHENSAGWVDTLPGTAV